MRSNRSDIWLGPFLIICALVYALFVYVAGTAYPYGAGTEQFIPIGASPGVSGKLSVQGRLIAVMPASYRVVVLVGLTEIPLTVASETLIYLDKSALRQHSEVGSWADLRIGQVVEVYARKWIKVRVEP